MCAYIAEIQANCFISTSSFDSVLKNPKFVSNYIIIYRLTSKTCQDLVKGQHNASQSELHRINASSFKTENP